VTLAAVDRDDVNALVLELLVELDEVR